MKKPQILILDGDNKHLRMLRLNLQNSGYEVEGTTSPKEALSLAVQLEPKIILMEALPTDLNKGGIINDLKAIAPMASFLLMAEQSRHGQISALASGFSPEGVLQKPVYIHELLSSIQNITTAHDPTVQLQRNGVAEGEFESGGLVDLLRALSAASVSGDVAVDLGPYVTTVLLAEGRVVDAWNNRMDGEAAALWLLRQQGEGRFTARSRVLDYRERIKRDLDELIGQATLHNQYLSGKLGDFGLDEGDVLEPDYARLALVGNELAGQSGDVFRLFDGRRSIGDVLLESPVSEVESIDLIYTMVGRGVLVKDGRVLVSATAPPGAGIAGTGVYPGDFVEYVPEDRVEPVAVAGAAWEQGVPAATYDYTQNLGQDQPEEPEVGVGADVTGDAVAPEQAQAQVQEPAQEQKQDQSFFSDGAWGGEEQASYTPEKAHLPGAAAPESAVPEQVSPFGGGGGMDDFFGGGAGVGDTSGAAGDGIGEEGSYGFDYLAEDDPSPHGGRVRQVRLGPLLVVAGIIVLGAIVAIFMYTGSGKSLGLKGRQTRDVPLVEKGDGTAGELPGAHHRDQVEDTLPDSLQGMGVPSRILEAEPRAGEDIPQVEPALDEGLPGPELDKQISEADFLRRRGEYGNAIRKYEQMLASHPEHIPVLMGVSKVYSDAMRNRDVVRTLTKVVELNPKQAEAWLSMGAAYQELGEVSKAVEAYLMYIELAPDGEHAGEVKKVIQNLSAR